MLVRSFINAAERGYVPDFTMIMAINHLLRQNLKQLNKGSMEEKQARLENYIEELSKSPIALQTQKANDQHYEVPTSLFQYMLGKRLKYSCCYWPEGVDDLNHAEEAMLKLYCERAGIKEGMNILELGCGWGSLSLYMAELFPGSKITAISNSKLQREHIEEEIRKKGLKNLKVITSDVSNFTSDETFDLVISIEMFEHMRNYELLMKKISQWLKPEGKLFIHIFCNRQYSYLFETKDDTDWMASNFFSGGQMPSNDLLLNFQKDLHIEKHWCVDGTHYAKTLRAWLKLLDSNQAKINEIIIDHYGKEESNIWFNRWRMFLLGCEASFNYDNGQEWFVSHYLFQKKGA